MEELYAIFETYNKEILRKIEPNPTENLTDGFDLLSLNFDIREKLLEKLSYDDLSRMEETCLEIKQQINCDEIKCVKYVHSLKYYGGMINVELVDENDPNVPKRKPKLAPIEIFMIETCKNVIIAPKYLEIDCPLSECDLFRISRTLEGKKIPTVKLGNTLYYGFVNVQRLPQICDNESFFALLSKIKAERFICHWKLNEIDLLRPEIQALHAVDLWGTVRPSLSIETLQAMRNPVIKVQYEDITDEHLQAILKDWQAGTRDIKYFLTSGNFNQQEVLASFNAFPIWTNDVEDDRVLNYLRISPNPKSTRRPVDILLLKRRNGEQMDDFLLLFFRMLKFAAATVEGLMEEKLQEEIKLNEAGAGEWEYYRK